MSAREKGADDPHPHALRGCAARRRRVGGDARRRRTGERTHVARAGAGERRRPVGHGRPRRASRATRSRARAPGEGQPHHRAQGALAGPRAHPAEPRQARGLRDPLRGPLQPRRHHRRRGARASARRAASPTRRPTTCSPRPTASSPGRSRARDVVSSYAGVRPLYDDGSDNPSEVTRDYVLKVDARGRQGAAAVDLRRQDHHLPPPGRGGDGEARALLPRPEGRLDRHRGRCPAATSGTSTRFRDEMHAALRGASGATWSTASCAATAAAPRACSATRSASADLGRAFRRRPHRARGRVPARARSGRATRRGRALAPHQVRACT